MKDELVKGIVGGILFTLIGFLFIRRRADAARHTFFWLEVEPQLKTARKIIVVFSAIFIFIGISNLLLIVIDLISKSSP